ncbi:chemotaxis protein CheX [Pilimelia columellifera]|uniref:Chemotaxis phosphatase CheX-like domain-containing protein n=1 Tax=Pilimelia columellifera subsp. columellifera TaxID=706583 RepID=A0ABN3N8P5_9ACTN
MSDSPGFVEPNDIDLKEMVDQVWESYLDPDGSAPLLMTGAGPDRFDAQASVSITGSWHGHVVFACSVPAAKLAAATFLAIPPEEVTEDDLADTLGELANIVGGNVKSMLPTGCFVSLPHVLLAPGALSKWPGVVRVCDLVGEWQGEPVSVSMWQEKREG